MNDKAFEKKVNRDVNQTKKDLTTLKDDNVTGLTKIKNDFVTLKDDGVTGVSRKFDHLADDTKKKVSGAVKTINQDVGHGLSQYNAKIQDVADRVPGGFSEKAARYPWVTVTISLFFGLLLGALLKPGRRPAGTPRLEELAVG